MTIKELRERDYPPLTKQPNSLIQSQTALTNILTVKQPYTNDNTLLITDNEKAYTIIYPDVGRLDSPS